MYEVESDGITRRHVFAGANRVCTVTRDEGRGTTDASYYHQDHLGSSSIITDADGNQIGHYEYTPYGTIAVQEIVSRPSPLVHHLYTGKELDNTGLYFYGARYYDPEIGRFITADTIVQFPYNPQSLNRYSYCDNNPINYIDPTGHFKFKKWFGKIFGAISAVIGTIVSGGNIMVGFQMFNLFNSLGNVVNTGNWGGFAGGLAGGILGGIAGVGWATSIAKGLGEATYAFGGGFLIGAAEMGLAGFGAAFGETLGSGGSFGEAMRAGGIGFGIGAITGGLIEGSYLGGYQTFAHGLPVEHFVNQGVVPPAIPPTLQDINPTAGVSETALTRTRKAGWGRYLHGTDKKAAASIKIAGLDWGSWITLPEAIDPATGKIATALNPTQFRRFVSQPRQGTGDWFVLLVAHNKGVRSEGFTAGGAPQFRVYGEHIITNVYSNPNQ